MYEFCKNVYMYEREKEKNVVKCTNVYLCMYLCMNNVYNEHINFM